MRHATHILFFATLAAIEACGSAVTPTTRGTRFGELSINAQQAELCELSQGVWYAGLMSCACPPKTLLHPLEGCRPVPAWEPQSLAAPPSSDVEDDGVSRIGGGDSSITRLQLGTLAMQIGTATNKRKLTPEDFKAVDPSTVNTERLTILAAPPADYMLTNALAHHMGAAYTAWVQTGRRHAEGPRPSPWHPGQERIPAFKKTCNDALRGRNFTEAAPLCDTTSAMLRDVRKRGRRHKGVTLWEQIAHEDTPNTASMNLAIIEARWKSPMLTARYVLHVQDEGVLQRHLHVKSQSEEMVVFIDATGTMTAAAISRVENEPPVFVDPHWRQVKPLPEPVKR